MDVEVDDQHAADGALREQGAGRDDQVVVDAEALAPIGEGVVGAAGERDAEAVRERPRAPPRRCRRPRPASAGPAPGSGGSRGAAPRGRRGRSARRRPGTRRRARAPGRLAAASGAGATVQPSVRSRSARRAYLVIGKRWPGGNGAGRWAGLNPCGTVASPQTSSSVGTPAALARSGGTTNAWTGREAHAAHPRADPGRYGLPRRIVQPDDDRGSGVDHHQRAVALEDDAGDLEAPEPGALEPPFVRGRRVEAARHGVEHHAHRPGRREVRPGPLERLHDRVADRELEQGAPLGAREGGGAHRTGAPAGDEALDGILDHGASVSRTGGAPTGATLRDVTNEPHPPRPTPHAIRSRGAFAVQEAACSRR